jgi:hypothetical protein
MSDTAAWVRRRPDAILALTRSSLRLPLTTQLRVVQLSGFSRTVATRFRLSRRDRSASGVFPVPDRVSQSRINRLHRRPP